MTKSSNTFVVWQISDGKPGHERQALGLLKAIENTLIKSKMEMFRFEGGLLKFFKQFHFNKANFAKRPNFIIGAGHKTHLSLLLLSKLFGGKTVVIMKPSIPIKFFDLCIVPGHDNIKGKNVVITQGPINPLKNHNIKKEGGLILIGGPSKHFKFDEQLVFDFIRKIIKEGPKIDWAIADSRRTTIKMKSLLEKLQLKSMTYYNNKFTDSKTFDAKLQSAKYVWATSDSMAMIYEALTVGAKVGIINLPLINKNNLLRNIKQLIRQNSSSEQVLGIPLIQIEICESETVAKKIKERFPDEFDK